MCSVKRDEKGGLTPRTDWPVPDLDILVMAEAEEGKEGEDRRRGDIVPKDNGLKPEEEQAG